MDKDESLKDFDQKTIKQIDKTLTEINFLITMIDEDVNNFVQSINTKDSHQRRKFRKQSIIAHQILIEAAKEFSNE